MRKEGENPIHLTSRKGARWLKAPNQTAPARVEECAEGNRAKPKSQEPGAHRIVSGVGMRDVSSRPGPFVPELVRKPSPAPWPDAQSHYSAAGSGFRNAEKRPKTIGGENSANSRPQQRVRESPFPWLPKEPNPTSFGVIAVANRARSLLAGSECGQRYYPNPSRGGRTR